MNLETVHIIIPCGHKNYLYEGLGMEVDGKWCSILGGKFCYGSLKMLKVLFMEKISYNQSKTTLDSINL